MRDEDASDVVDRVIKPVVVVLSAAGLALAFLVLVGIGVGMVLDGGARAGLGVGICLLVVVGAWATFAILRDALALQRISRAAAEAGCELDVSALPHRPSGRVETEAADALFDRVSREYQDSPDDWRTVYRLARAYDHAGDRARARETMRTAMRLHRESQTTGGGTS